MTIATPTLFLQHRRPLDHRGFSLIEVLVAIIILSFGLLGMVGLQAASLKANREAQYQSTAVRMARELGELIRGNKVVAVARTTADNPYLIAFSATSKLPTASVNCIARTTNCNNGASPAANQILMAQWQVRDWLSRIRSELPDAQVTVCFDNAPFDGSGLPRWACNDAAGAADVMYVKIGWTKSALRGDAVGAQAFDRATTPTVVLPVLAGSTT
ncbi:MAG: type IV pilus modification protein PilV [Rhodoferax sp.]|nr:type IV pilus modification protein PilV [Rhodoferax sp.]